LFSYVPLFAKTIEKAPLSRQVHDPLQRPENSLKQLETSLKYCKGNFF